MEETDEEKHKIYEIDDELYYVDNDDGSIYHIDFQKDEEDASKENDDLNQDSSEEKDEDEDETEPEDNPEKDPKKDGSGKGKRANQGRSGCKETEEKGKGKEESEDEEDLDENKDEKLDLIQVSDPNLITNIKNAIKNNIKGGCDMDFENKETSETKPDGSEAMKERRITQCMEESGKSREACTKEVRKKMHENEAEAVNPEDMNKESEVKDTVEVCTKEYDFLKKESEELKSLKAEKEKADNNLESLKADFLVYKKKVDDKEASEKEVKRGEIVKRISHDFDIPEDKLIEKTIEQLLDHEEILELALKRDTEEAEKETFGEEEDFKEIGDRIHKRYFLEV